MRPNLSFENFAAVLAALGTSTIVACGGAAPAPANATDVTPATTAAHPGQSSCSAAACGATANGSAPGAAPATPAPSTPSTDQAAVTTPGAAPMASASAAPVTAKAPPKKPTGGVRPKPAGEASCGQGTCASNAKPKVY